MNSSQPSPKQKPQPSTGPSSTPTSAAMELMQPGPEHAQLAKWVGTWDVAFTHALKNGDALKDGEPAKHDTGTSIMVSVYNGRYIREECTSTFDGKQFAGTGTTGYDRAAKHFVNTWYDNMGTGICRLTGTPSHEGREITYRGTMTCPSQMVEMQLRHVLAWESDDRFTLTMFNSSNGTERKAMELVYTRRA